MFGGCDIFLLQLQWLSSGKAGVIQVQLEPESLWYPPGGSTVVSLLKSSLVFLSENHVFSG